MSHSKYSEKRRLPWKNNNITEICHTKNPRMVIDRDNDTVVSKHETLVLIWSVRPHNKLQGFQSAAIVSVRFIIKQWWISLYFGASLWSTDRTPHEPLIGHVFSHSQNPQTDHDRRSPWASADQRQCNLAPLGLLKPINCHMIAKTNGGTLLLMNLCQQTALDHLVLRIRIMIAEYHNRSTRNNTKKGLDKLFAFRKQFCLFWMIAQTRNID